MNCVWRRGMKPMRTTGKHAWRLLESPGMFDLRGPGEYARAIERVLLTGSGALAEVQGRQPFAGALRADGSACAGAGGLELHWRLWQRPPALWGMLPGHGFGDGQGFPGRLCASELNSFSAALRQAAGEQPADGVGELRPSLFAGAAPRSCDVPGGRRPRQSIDALGSGDAHLIRDLDLLASLSVTAGNFMPMPDGVVRVPGEQAGKTIEGVRCDLDGRFDLLLAAIYRWVMGVPEPNGPGAAVRACLESGCDAGGNFEGNCLALWVCGDVPLGNQVDRQLRWDGFVSRNFLHDYVGLSWLGGLFGGPIEYSEDPRWRVVQMSARIIARNNRMRNAARALGLDDADIAAAFGG